MVNPPAKVLVLVLVTARLVSVVVPEEREPGVVIVPKVASCENKFVDDAVVLKKLVVVPAVRERVPAVSTPRLAFVEKRFVDDAVVEKRFVVVAFPPTAVWKVRLVVEAVTAPRVVV